MLNCSAHVASGPGGKNRWLKEMHNGNSEKDISHNFLIIFILSFSKHWRLRGII